MAHLSDLSIGFIVGGCVLFTAMILGFIVWRIIDSRRHAKPKESEPRNGQSRADTEAAIIDVANRINGRGSRATGSVYSEIHVEDDHRITTANKSTGSPTTQRQGFPASDNTDDSGFSESQLIIGRSEVYARLHDVNNPVQNVYNYLADDDSGQGSHMHKNSVSAYSDDEDANASSLATPTRKTSTNQTDQHIEETTPRNQTEEDNGNDYSCLFPRMDISEERRSAIYEPADEDDPNLCSVRDDTSNTSRHSDAVSVLDTPF